MLRRFIPAKMSLAWLIQAVLWTFFILTGAPLALWEYRAGEGIMTIILRCVVVAVMIGLACKFIRNDAKDRENRITKSEGTQDE